MCLCKRKYGGFLSKKRHSITGNRKHKKIDHRIDFSISDDNITEVS